MHIFLLKVGDARQNDVCQKTSARQRRNVQRLIQGYPSSVWPRIQQPYLTGKLGQVVTRWCVIIAGVQRQYLSRGCGKQAKAPELRYAIPNRILYFLDPTRRG